MGDAPPAGSRRRVSSTPRGAAASPFRWVAGWKLWQLPRRVLVLVVSVHVATVAATLGTAWAFPITHEHVVVASVLGVLGVVHLELSRGIERLRAKEAGAGPYYDLKTVWNVAAMLLLPPILAAAVIVLTHTYGFLRVHRRDDRNPHRWIYSCATVVLASQAAVVVLATGTDAFPGIPGPTPLHEWLVVFAAVVVRWLVNYMLIIVVSGLMRPQMTFRDAFVQLGEQVNEAAATALAIIAAVLLHHGYFVLLVCVYFVIGVLQQTSYYHHWKRERPFDPLTGVYSRTSFVEQAQAILERAKFRGDTVGCLLLDLDFFKRVNDVHGHLVGDKALVTLAEAIKHEIRAGQDVAARWGGEEFVVLVPDVNRHILAEVAERIRRRVAATPVVYNHKDPRTGESSVRTVRMTASIGAAILPDPEHVTAGLPDLVEHADKLMYAAKRAGRNRFCVTLPPPDARAAVPPQVPSPVDS